MITYHCDRCQKTVSGKELFDLQLNYKCVEKNSYPSYFASLLKDISWCKECLAHFGIGLPEKDKPPVTLEDFISDMVHDAMQSV